MTKLIFLNYFQIKENPTRIKIKKIKKKKHEECRLVHRTNSILLIVLEFQTGLNVINFKLVSLKSLCNPTEVKISIESVLLCNYIKIGWTTIPIFWVCLISLGATF